MADPTYKIELNKIPDNLHGMDIHRLRYHPSVVADMLGIPKHEFLPPYNPEEEYSSGPSHTVHGSDGSKHEIYVAGDTVSLKSAGDTTPAHTKALINHIRKLHMERNKKHLGYKTNLLTEGNSRDRGVLGNREDMFNLYHAHLRAKEKHSKLGNLDLSLKHKEAAGLAQGSFHGFSLIAKYPEYDEEVYPAAMDLWHKYHAAAKNAPLDPEDLKSSDYLNHSLKESVDQPSSLRDENILKNLSDYHKGAANRWADKSKHSINPIESKQHFIESQRHNEASRRAKAAHHAFSLVAEYPEHGRILVPLANNLRKDYVVAAKKAKPFEVDDFLEKYAPLKEDGESYDIEGIKKGAFHRWLGKAPDEKITNADIEKGLASKDKHVRKMAQFALNAKKFRHPLSENARIEKGDIKVYDKKGDHIGTVSFGKYQNVAHYHPHGIQKEPHRDDDSLILKNNSEKEKNRGVDFIYDCHKDA